MDLKIFPLIQSIDEGDHFKAFISITSNKSIKYYITDNIELLHLLSYHCKHILIDPIIYKLIPNLSYILQVNNNLNEINASQLAILLKIKY